MPRVQRRLFVVGLLTVSALTVAGFAQQRAAWRRGLVRQVRLGGNRHVVALSFDDGPSPRWTPTVLDLLQRFGASASFFVVGRAAQIYPGLVRAELAVGDEIGNHTYSHPDLRLLSQLAVQKEIEWGAAAIRAAGAPQPILFRPPMGWTDPTVEQIAARGHYRTVLWSLALEHYVNHQGVERGVRSLLAQVRPGAIILAHDGGVLDRTRTIEALPLLLQGLRARGYRMVSVGQLLCLARESTACSPRRDPRAVPTAMPIPASAP